MQKQFAFLHLEDNSADAELIQQILIADKIPCTIDRAVSKEQFTLFLRERSYDLILSDYSLPSFDGLTALTIVNELAHGVPFIFVSGAIGEERAIDSLKRGATDYVLKDRLSRLAPAVRRALSESQERRQRRESETLYRTLVETSPDAIILTDLQTIIKMVNQQTLTLYGGTIIDELIGRSMFEFISPEDHDRARVNVLRTLEAGSIRNIEYTLLRKDGSRFLVELDASLIRDAAGNPKAFLAVIKDISDRKRVLQALMESETRYRSLIETSADAVVLSSLDGSLQFCNKRTAELLNYEHVGRLIGRSFFEFIHPSHHERARRKNQETLEYENVRNFEYTLLRRDGSPIQVEVSSSLIRDPEGRPKAYTNFLRDITERRIAEEKIRQQAALLDVDPAAITVRDLNDRILFWNKGAEQLYGWTQEDVLGKPATDIISRDALSHYLNSKKILLEKGEWRGEWVNTTKNGTPITVESQWNLVRDEEGKPKSVYAVDVDITEKKKLQEQILRSQRLESVGTLAGGIAHDLNNVLSPIILSLQVLRRKLIEENDKKLLAMIESSAQRGAQMIRQVLTFARGIEGERIPLNVGHLVQELQEITRQTFPKSITVKTDVIKDLWPVTGDATQLHQVLLNLCVNARDAMPHGGSILIEGNNVELDEAYAKMHPEAKPGRYITLSVTDTGTGMPPGIVERIFEPFFTTKESGKGTGLGLSTTLGIIKSHGGFMNVYSEVGRGSKFLLYLPAFLEAVSKSEEERLEEIPEGRGEVVLVADDESTILEITKAALEAHGYRVLTATDGTEAIAQAAANKGTIDVVVCDMSMPFLDGSATIRALRKMDPKIRFIAVSGLFGNAESKEFEHIGGIVSLQKPYTADKLLKSLRSLLDTR